MKKYLFLVLALTLAIGGYFALDSEQVPVASASKAYNGTIYVAGMGGHFAKAVVTIDPAAANPIVIKELDRVVIGDTSYATHDARIDANDRNVMYWSTYKLDGNKKVHVGKTDLKTGKVVQDVALDLDPRAKWTGALYCASGQSKKSFIPITMTDEGYIDVFDKATLELKHRVFLDGLGYAPKGYKFIHGINSPDMKKLAVAINMADETTPNGKVDILLLDMAELEKGKAKVLAKNTLTGTPKDTLTFRQSFTPDGKYLLQSAADRFWLIDGNTLALVDEEMVDGQNHDAIPTADGKYAILTMRVPRDCEGANITDGELRLYDIAAKKVVGGGSSVCYACHEGIGIKKSAVLCGADANW